MARVLRFVALCFLIPLAAFAEYELSVCTIFQNEASYLKEWIEFHKLQGVEHFYLYNHQSQDHFRKVLKRYITSGTVTLIDWDYSYEPGDSDGWRNIQLASYQHCLDNYGKSTKWLAVIDSDEFLFCPTGLKLTEFLKDYTQYGGICAHWLCFGTSFVKSIPKNGLMIEFLTLCSETNHIDSLRVKSIIQPKYATGPASSHTFNFTNGFYAVNADNKKIVHRCNGPYVMHDKIRINHYWTRAENAFELHKIQSRRKHKAHENKDNLEDRAKKYNLSENNDILQFVPELRKQMELD